MARQQRIMYRVSIWTKSTPALPRPGAPSQWLISLDEVTGVHSAVQQTGRYDNTHHLTALEFMVFAYQVDPHGGASSEGNSTNAQVGSGEVSWRVDERIDHTPAVAA